MSRCRSGSLPNLAPLQYYRLQYACCNCYHLHHATATATTATTLVQLRNLERECEAALDALDALALELASVPSGTLLHLTAASDGQDALEILDLLLR